eukprot:750094-Hanusia_phi.AAC.7
MARLGPDDYILAVIDLYLDIINLLLPVVSPGESERVCWLCEEAGCWHGSHELAILRLPPPACHECKSCPGPRLSLPRSHSHYSISSHQQSAWRQEPRRQEVCPALSPTLHPRALLLTSLCGASSDPRVSEVEGVWVNKHCEDEDGEAARVRHV